MTPAAASSAWEARSSIEQGSHDSTAFRAALLSVPPAERDAWVDLVLGSVDVPDDGPELPRGCVPYLPCSVDVLLRAIDEAEVAASDVFVDIGAGVGRAALLVHLLTGARAIGVEIQRALVSVARRLASPLPRVSFLEGDAATGPLPVGSVYFLYCPFGGDRLEQFLEHLHSNETTQPLRLCCVDLPLPTRSWISPNPSRGEDLRVYRAVSKFSSY